MSYLCGSESFVDLSLRRAQQNLSPAVAMHLCATGSVGLQGTCTQVPQRSDLPAALGSEPTVSLSRLGPILADANVPPFTVSIEHPQSPEFDYLTALRIDNYRFRVVGWNPLSLDPNCCAFLARETVFLYGQVVSSDDLAAIVGLLYQLNARMQGAPLQISFRSKAGVVYESQLTA